MNSTVFYSPLLTTMPSELSALDNCQSAFLPRMEFSVVGTGHFKSRGCFSAAFSSTPCFSAPAFTVHTMCSYPFLSGSWSATLYGLTGNQVRERVESLSGETFCGGRPCEQGVARLGRTCAGVHCPLAAGLRSASGPQRLPD